MIQHAPTTTTQTQKHGHTQSEVGQEKKNTQQQHGISGEWAQAKIRWPAEREEKGTAGNGRKFWIMMEVVAKQERGKGLGGAYLR